ALLDFGLAAPLADGAHSRSETEPSPVTGPGTVLGTAGYMAPEQVRGMPADHRSDIFGLGCVLYEMLSGRRAFRAASAAATLASTLRDGPPPRSSVARSVPAAVDHLVGRCLEKRPEDRFQSARDLSFALDALAGASSGARVRTSSGGTSARTAWIAVAAAAL